LPSCALAPCSKIVCVMKVSVVMVFSLLLATRLGLGGHLQYHVTT